MENKPGDHGKILDHTFGGVPTTEYLKFQRAGCLVAYRRKLSEVALF